MKYRKRRKREAAIVTRTRYVCCPHAGDRAQPVRVTNWMGQVWVLLMANAVVTALTWHMADRIGLCLWWASCSTSYFWSGVLPSWWPR